MWLFPIFLLFSHRVEGKNRVEEQQLDTRGSDKDSKIKSLDDGTSGDGSPDKPECVNVKKCSLSSCLFGLFPTRLHFGIKFIACAVGFVFIPFIVVRFFGASQGQELAKNETSLLERIPNESARNGIILYWLKNLEDSSVEDYKKLKANLQNGLDLLMYGKMLVDAVLDGRLQLTGGRDEESMSEKILKLLEEEKGKELGMFEKIKSIIDKILDAIPKSVASDGDRDGGSTGTPVLDQSSSLPLSTTSSPDKDATKGDDVLKVVNQLLEKFWTRVQFILKKYRADRLWNLGNKFAEIFVTLLERILKAVELSSEGNRYLMSNTVIPFIVPFSNVTNYPLTHISETMVNVIDDLSYEKQEKLFKNISHILEAIHEHFEEKKKMTPEFAKSLVDFLSNENNQGTIKELLEMLPAVLRNWGTVRTALKGAKGMISVLDFFNR